MIEIVVHTFRVGDVEDPVLYASGPLYEWEHSEQGQWIMNHAVESPVWYQSIDYMNYGHKFIIRAKLNDQDALFYRLKWGI